MQQRRWLQSSWLALSLAAAACASGVELTEPDPDQDQVQSEPDDDQIPGEARFIQRNISLKIPTSFRAERADCAALAQLEEPPADLTINGFFACLSDDSRRSLEAAYARKASRIATAPADLGAFLTSYGDRRVAETRLRDLAFTRGPREERGEGIAPPAAAPRLLNASSGDWGLDPTTCGKSCLSVRVPVVNGTRTLGTSPAWTGAEAAPGDGRRLLDEINPGSFPNYDQDDLRNDELVSSGCGPVSAVNLFEWWNIPVYHGSTRLTSFDERTEYIAGRMDTLEGINFTDDEELIDFVTHYPAELYQAGRIPGYPGYHYMVDDPAGWKVMLSYVSRGYPVIVLYASGEISLHWAVIAGYTGGKLRIANAPNLTLSEFYKQWHDWEALSWYASWAADLYVDPDTFVALTGWGNDGRPDPDRFAARTLGAAPAGYMSSGYAYGFRYCASAPDGIGYGSEMIDIPFWSDPASFFPGYCLYTNRQAGFNLVPSPSGGSASSHYNSTLGLSVTKTTALASFINANPGVRCEFRGYDGSSWTSLVSRRCSASGALSYNFINSGRWKKIELFVHASELARTTWNVSVN